MTYGQKYSPIMKLTITQNECNKDENVEKIVLKG